MHAAPLIPLLKPALDALKASLAAARRRLGKRKYERLVSATITELLKEHPDLTAAQAQLAAIRATGVDPDESLLRAESMLTSVRSYTRAKASVAGRAKMSAAMRARWARRRAPAKTKKPKKKSSGRKRSASATRMA